MTSLAEVCALMELFVLFEARAQADVPPQVLERKSELSQGIYRDLAQLMQSGYDGEVPFGSLGLTYGREGRIYDVPRFSISDGKLYGLFVPTKGLFKDKRSEWMEVDYKQMPTLDRCPIQNLETITEGMKKILPNSSI